MRMVPKSVWIARDDDGEYYVYTERPVWQEDAGEFGFADASGDSKLANLCQEQLEEWLSPIALDNGDVIQLLLEFRL